MKTYMLMILAALCVFLWLRPEVEKGWEARNKVAALEWQVEALLNRPTPAPVVVTRVVVQEREVHASTGSATGVVWVWVVVAAGAVAGLVLGFMVIASAIVAPPRPSPKGRETGRGALHPGDPGFDEAMHRAAGAMGGVVLRQAQQPGGEGAYWLCVPGREPVRVVRLLEDRGQ